MNEQRPVVQLSPTEQDKWLDRMALLVLVLVWAYTIIKYASLPETIPVHFNASGEIDRYGGKATVFLLPAIISVVVGGMTLLNRYPHIFNYPKAINSENAAVEYARATRLLRIVKLVIVFFTAWLMFTIINGWTSTRLQLSWWALLVFIGALVVPVVLYIYRSYKRENV